MKRRALCANVLVVIIVNLEPLCFRDSNISFSYVCVCCIRAPFVPLCFLF